MKKDLATLKQEYEAAITRSRGYIALKHVTAPLNVASGAYVKALERRVQDLERIVKVVNEPVGRDVTAELGHVRGLDVLQWLNNAWQSDIDSGVDSALAGICKLAESDIGVIKALEKIGYANDSGFSDDCWITASGREYLATLKQEAFGKSTSEGAK